MIDFADANGDHVSSYRNSSGTLAGTLGVACVAGDEEVYVPLALTPSMARALAEDLLAFADSAEGAGSGGERPLGQCARWNCDGDHKYYRHHPETGNLVECEDV